jgi:hypothetical protein
LRAAGSLTATATLALGLGACGGGTHFANRPRPAIPVDLTVYVNNSHVSISPARVGAGPVILYVTNQASGPETVAIRSQTGSTLASSGAINRGQTAQISTNLRAQGSYSIAAGKISPAHLQITKPRPNSDNALLEP